MKEINLSLLNVSPATVHDADSVSWLFAQNQKALYAESIPLTVWQELLSCDDPDEKHFLICQNALPVAYLKINGLLQNHHAWLSMLFVADDYKRQGVGTFAVKWAEQYVKKHGFAALHIQTDQNNLAAIRCYLKSGYQIYDDRGKIKFIKNL